MQLPEELLESLKSIESFDQEAFEKIHASGEQITSIRINPNKFSIENLKFKIENKVPWTRYGVYLAQRPSFTFDPLFHSGCYYVQEASSMFIEQALEQSVDLSTSLKVLDLCAAPGGKSTHIQSLISKDSLLVSNEVIQSRVPVLKDNIVKWGSENVVVTRNDPKDFSRLENYFDIIVIDAPCSGSGLFRREPGAIEEWSLNNVKLCSLRQQRIIADVFPALKKNGILIYCTCSYSKEEDEDICSWMTNELPIANCKLQIDKSWNIVESSAGYRFWPNKLRGEGFFLACFRKKDGEEYFTQKIKNKPELLNKKEIAIIESWIGKNSFQFIRRNDTVHAIPEKLVADINFLSDHFRTIYEGVAMGQLIREKLIPDHSLAMSNLLTESIPATELNYDNAIEYLKKKDIKIGVTVNGWQLVKYENHDLGWINALPNRINNYYPKELRILKES
ncbi:MAG TPA: hypothetical protein VHD35_05195 [Chitinophagaceae bacterium]|nr:hypothetical protein [Chitinophagaceae bacterium]